MKRLSVLLVFVFAVLAASQDKVVQAFVIDPSKPYVYLKFDHIGPRKPIQDGEPNTGIWLRVVNNCRIPIVLGGFNLPEGIAGVGLMDEVVENQRIMQIYSDKDEPEMQRREKLRQSKHKPSGYAVELVSLIRVQPGTDVLFSVPTNHVDDDWFMRVKFALDLNKSSVAIGPFTYLEFTEWDIPKEVRVPNPAKQ